MQRACLITTSERCEELCCQYLGWLKSLECDILDPDTGICTYAKRIWILLFRQWYSRWQLKIIFFSPFFCVLLLEATFTSFSKIKGHKEVTKKKESRFFLGTVFAWWWKDPELDQDLVLMDPDPGGPKTYGSGSSTLPAVISTRAVHT